MRSVHLLLGRELCKFAHFFLQGFTDLASFDITPFELVHARLLRPAFDIGHGIAGRRVLIRRRRRFEKGQGFFPLAFVFFNPIRDDAVEFGSILFIGWVDHGKNDARQLPAGLLHGRVTVANLEVVGDRLVVFLVGGGVHGDDMP